MKTNRQRGYYFIQRAISEEWVVAFYLETLDKWYIGHTEIQDVTDICENRVIRQM